MSAWLPFLLIRILAQEKVVKQINLERHVVDRLTGKSSIYDTRAKEWTNWLQQI